jgi:hypothetical protein
MPVACAILFGVVRPEEDEWRSVGGEFLPTQEEASSHDCVLAALVEGMGMTQGQNFDLEVLAADCADEGVYQFSWTRSPEPFVAGLGTPVNPVAIK